MKAREIEELLQWVRDILEALHNNRIGFAIRLLNLSPHYVALCQNNVDKKVENIAYIVYDSFFQAEKTQAQATLKRRLGTVAGQFFMYI